MANEPFEGGASRAKDVLRSVLKSNPGLGRRRFLQTGLAVSPVILTIKSQPAWAHHAPGHNPPGQGKNKKSSQLSPTHLSHRPKK